MLITPHFVTGVVIASKVPAFWPAAIIAVLSHFYLDSIPHRDTIGSAHINLPNVLLILGDVILTFVLMYFVICPENLTYSLIIGGFAILPDLIAAPGLIWPKYFKLPVLNIYYRWHVEMLQYARREVNLFWGILSQVLVIVVALYILLK